LAEQHHEVFHLNGGWGQPTQMAGMTSVQPRALSGPPLTFAQPTQMAGVTSVQPRALSGPPLTFAQWQVTQGLC
jgi:hypothetical protein